MSDKYRFIITLLCASLLLSGCEKDPLSQKGKITLPEKTSAPAAKAEAADGTAQQIAASGSPAASDPGVKEVAWDDLIPADWRPDPDLVFKYNNGDIDDKDPRIIALKIKIDKLVKLAPVNNTLNGKQIKIPGFVVPIEGDGKEISEFLLVPYHGACIHVPPPPANQIVFVRSKDGKASARKMMETVWITGTMKVEKVKNDVAEAGYTLYADKIESYE